MSDFTHLCRNRVYRQGIVKRCNRPTHQEHCEPCNKALNEQKLRILGLSEAEKKPSNVPDDLEVDGDFEIHDGYDEDNREPGDVENRKKSSLNDGPDGAKQGKSSPYLK